MRAETARIARAHRDVLGWYDREARRFPWRAHRDPYRTLVAEVMLQQTQTSRVAPIYERFVERFPSVHDLARAPLADVIEAWRGLGYNRRAVALHRAARAIVENHDGIVPSDLSALRALPGVGAYTATAVACFAYDADVAVVDVNVARVLSRAAIGLDADDVRDAEIRAVATAWVPERAAYRWNQALMDIGATLCRGSVPRCEECPLARVCRYDARARSAPKQRRPGARFEGSRRQRRGRIVESLREAGERGLTVPALAARLGVDVPALEELLEALAADGLISVAGPARRSVVTLPR